MQVVQVRTASMSTRRGTSLLIAGHCVYLVEIVASEDLRGGASVAGARCKRVNEKRDVCGKICTRQDLRNVLAR